jgi:ADP-ribose pyrophosphatase YjhB (NUDIX family)
MNLKEIELRYGKPKEFEVEIEMGEWEFGVLRESQRDGRSSDVTLFILVDGQVVVIQKPFHPAGVYRAPSGGIIPGEGIEETAKREALEETGLMIELKRYLLRAKPTFICKDEKIKWTSHVFLAIKQGGELKPQDTREIKEVKLVTIEELQTKIRDKLIKSGSGGLLYRAMLTDAALASLRTSFLNTSPRSE